MRRRAAQAFPDLSDHDAVVSAIGIRKDEGPGPLLSGARLLTASQVRVVWLGALGTGASTGAGGTVFHAPDLWVGAGSPSRRTVPLALVRRPVLPPHLSRASLAALMLDEAQTGDHAGTIAVPLGS